MNKRKVAVITGGAGFLGSHMADLLLEKGYHVRAIDNFSSGREENLSHLRDRADFRFEVMDVRNVEKDSVLFQGADFVFHFAGAADIVPSIEKPAEYLSTNLMGTVSALEAARHAGVNKFVYAASSSCYGKNCRVPTGEDAPIAPEYPYALSKYLAEEAVFHWQKVYRLPVVSLRIFNAYGPRSRIKGAYGAVFKVFMAQKRSGKPFTVVGDGSQKRDFVYVTDVVRAFLLAAESNKESAVYNLGAGNPQNINRLVELLGGKAVHIPRRPGEPDCTWADISKIRRELGWEPLVSFEEGVATMLHHIEDWRDAPVWEPHSIEAATKSWFEMLEKSKK